MPAVTEEQMQTLAPYVAGAQPDERGEIEIYCPRHLDSRRSASVNVEKGVWYCHAGCGGGSIRQLVLSDGDWVPMETRGVTAARPPAATTAAVAPTAGQVMHWHRRLRREAHMRRWLWRKRGLTQATIRKAKLGWNGRVFTIPVYDAYGNLLNVRHYDPRPAEGRSKIWNTKGMGQARIYPARLIEKLVLADPVLFLEGEFDTLLAHQHGMLAVTRTDGAGKPWHDEWTALFVGQRVYLCHDRDEAGMRSDYITAEALRDVADVWQCHLPFAYRAKNGKDLTDYLLQFKPRSRDDALEELLVGATPWRYQ